MLVRRASVLRGPARCCTAPRCTLYDTYCTPSQSGSACQRKGSARDRCSLCASQLSGVYHASSRPRATQTCQCKAGHTPPPPQYCSALLCVHFFFLSPNFLQEHTVRHRHHTRLVCMQHVHSRQQFGAHGHDVFTSITDSWCIWYGMVWHGVAWCGRHNLSTSPFEFCCDHECAAARSTLLPNTHGTTHTHSLRLAAGSHLVHIGSNGMGPRVRNRNAIFDPLRLPFGPVLVPGVSVAAVKHSHSGHARTSTRLQTNACDCGRRAGVVQTRAHAGCTGCA